MPYRVASKVLLVVLALVMLTWGCGDGGGIGQSELSLDVDGTPATTTAMSLGVDAAGNTIIAASGSGWTLDLRFPGAVAGTFSSGQASGAIVTYTDAAGTAFVASDTTAGSSYTLTITGYDLRAVEGTLTVTVVGPDGATHTLSGTLRLVIPAINSQNPYEGTYIGIFRVQGQVLQGYDPNPPYDPIWGSLQTASFRVTVELDHLATAAGSAVYYITHANVSDDYFGCDLAGCVPTQNLSIATLPYPPGTPTPSGASQAGQGFLLEFPNGSSLSTDNDAGALFTSTDGRTTGNTLGLDNPWITLDSQNGTFTEARLGEGYGNLNPDTRSKSWALTKSAL